MSTRIASRGSNFSRADWLLRRLADAGERMTGPREIVVRALAAQPGVINPEALSYDLHPQGVGRATVYRTLEHLLAKGEATERVDVAGESTYMLCEPAHHHHHAICANCGKVDDVDCSAVDQFAESLCAIHGFELDSHKMEFLGRCRDCR